MKLGDTIARRLKENPTITVQCFDGTITEIAELPETATTGQALFTCPRHGLHQAWWNLVFIAAHIESYHGGPRRE